MVPHYPIGFSLSPDLISRFHISFGRLRIFRASDSRSNTRVSPLRVKAKTLHNVHDCHSYMLLQVQYSKIEQPLDIPSWKPLPETTNGNICLRRKKTHFDAHNLNQNCVE
ncbi:unnamed protein product [Sympodiomycopsis kandeliae]